MKISYHKVLFALAAYLCALNFVFFAAVLDGLKKAEDPVLLGFTIFAGVFFILLSTLYVLAPPRLIKITGSFFIAVSAFSAYFMYNYGALLNQDMMITVLETDNKEAFSYLNFKLILWTLFLVILPIGLLIALKIEYKKGIKTAFLRGFCGFVLSLSFAGVPLLLNSQSVIPFFRNNSNLKKLHLPYYPIISFARALNSKLSPPKPLEMIAADATRASNDASKPKLLVFVLGETARAASYSALGYSKNDTNAYTKPFVAANKAAYFDALSCGTLTAVSVPCMFSHQQRVAYDDDINAQNAIDFLASTGVNVSWYGNNNGGCKGVCNRVSWLYFGKEFDDILITALKNQLSNYENQPKDAIIVLHILGSHGPTYYQRYPNEMKKFTPTCDTSDLAKCSSDEIINTYDNTILYTDYLISEFIAELEKNESFEGSLIYISDHGESLGENGIYLHGLPYAIAPDEQTHVPLMFYSKNADLMSRIKKGVSFSQDNIFHTLLGHFGVLSKYYDKNLDMFER